MIIRTTAAFIVVGFFSVTAQAQEPRGRVVEDGQGQGRAVTRAITAFPVPFTDHFHVALTGYTGEDVTVELIPNNSGPAVLTHSGMYTGVLHFNTAALPTGNYLLVVRNRGQIMGTREVVKAFVH